jgi:hypothetical protein
LSVHFFFRASGVPQTPMLRLGFLDSLFLCFYNICLKT